MNSLLHTNSNYTPKRLAVKLSPKGNRSVFSEHPWIFSDSIIKINKEGQSGDIAVIFNQKDNKVIGVGLYDLESPIRIKMLHYGRGITINEEFFDTNIKEAFKKRESLLKTNTNSYRLLFGENDKFPGLIADVYTNILVVKIYSKIWLPYLESILKSLLQVSQCETIVLRLSRNLQNSKNVLLNDGDVIYGSLKNEVVEFIEHNIHFSANVIIGHKTGYFLDHRHNRKRVGALSKGKTVLDVFSYSGGFSVHALANEATEVTSLDISAQAIEAAKANGKLNTYSGIHKTIVGDAFVELKNLIRMKEKFDVVVIDPPSFAKRQTEVDLAKKKYAQLADLGSQLVAKSGLLVLASCSSRVSSKSFFDINIHVLSQQSKQFEVIETTLHDVDHPVTFPEGAYLKCGYYRFSD